MPDILLIWLEFACGKFQRTLLRHRRAKRWLLPAALADGACGAVGGDFSGCWARQPACCGARAPVSVTGARVGLSGERVKYLLHVIILFELVDHRQNFRRLFFRKLGRNGADIFVFR